MGQGEADAGRLAEARSPEAGEAFLALGSNAGDRPAALHLAVRALAALSGSRAVRPSPVYESEAHTRAPGEVQPAYLNAVVQLRTSLTPGELLRQAWRIEARAGRDRAAEAGRWQPRPLDVDLLVVGRQTRRSERLQLPHPRLAERRFVLRPWVDLVPNLRVPAPFGKTTSELLVNCPDRAVIRRAAEQLR